MRIGIDARFLTHPQHGGFKTYTESLISSLSEIDQDNQYILYIDRPPDENTKIPDKPNFSYRVVPNTIPFLGMVWREQIRLPRLAARDKLDLFHSPCLSAPLFMGCPSVVTIHDMIWLTHKRILGSNSAPSSLRLRVQHLYYHALWNYHKLHNWIAGDISPMVITVSEASKSDIVRTLNFSPDKIFITHEAASGNYRQIDDKCQIVPIREKFELPCKFILALGSADPRKNIKTLIESYALLPAAFRERYELVVVWNFGTLTDSMEQHAANLGVKNQVRFLEWVSNEELVLLYNAASLFVFPSLYEGFGLPLLEAMACGTPVVAANNSSIPEIADQAALLAEAKDPKMLADKMFQALSDESVRNDLISKGFKRAEAFSWKKCALLTIAVYEQIILARQLAGTSIKRSSA
jgi:glycosyltransferase involved in cell wall biosynthesis